ncbi:P-loop containing nucleoside triphosphate hydrolase [Gracilaria domingensis]|nr:P-loop containing nucleoside triphosphate hydrolase [Gracilaria domingensis]
MASGAHTFTFSRSDGAISATAPFLDTLLPGTLSSRDFSASHSTPSIPASVSIASASECHALGLHATSLLINYLEESASHPPVILGISHGDSSAEQSRAQYLALFWPHAQHARARVGLPHKSFRILLNLSHHASGTAFKPLQQLNPAVDVDALLQLARTAATFSPQYASVVHDLYHITDLIEHVNSSIHARRQIAAIRMVAVARLDPRDHRVLSEANSLVSLDPSNPTSYLQRAQARCALKQYWLAVLDVWYAVLILEIPHSAESRVHALLARCLPHVPYIGLNVAFVPQQSNVQERFPVLYNCLVWERLSTKQRITHCEIVNHVWSRRKSKTLALPSVDKSAVERASSYTAYILHLGKVDKAPCVVELPQAFTWLVPLRLAVSAMPSSRNQITAMESAGFTQIVSLTIEQPMQSSWFSGSCRNLYLPIRRGRAATFHQIDMFVAQVANAKVTLVHSMEGNGRTGLLMAVWLMLFGFSTYPSLCSQCTTLNSTDETHKFIGGCKDTECALAVRQPEMSAQDAVKFVKSEVTTLRLSFDQEKLLNDFYTELWRRYTVLHDLIWNENRYELVYPSVISVKENDADLELRGRPLQKFPSMIVLCGLPGSGKSVLANRLVALNKSRFVPVCQDTLGSRDSCLSSVSHAAKRPEVCPIVDRCNPRLSDREEWFRCAFCPSSAIIVHLDIPPELCIMRAERRINHPTLVPGSASHVIQGVSKAFQAPSDKDLQTGFEAIYVIRGRFSIESFLNQMGGFSGAKRQEIGKSLRVEQDRKALTSCSDRISAIPGERSLAASDMETRGKCVSSNEGVVRIQNAGVSANDGENGIIDPGREGYARFAKNASSECCSTGVDNSPERPIRLSGFFKFPRTRHILNLGGSVTDDDIVMDNRELNEMIKILNMTQLEKNMTLTIEEKVDGANLGFSLCPESSNILVQNRSHFVNTKSHLQFKLINFFVQTYEEDLRKVLRAGERVLYGEWMYAKHSILYSKLPSVFLAFDLFDKAEHKFLSRSAFRKELEDTKICAVREIVVPSEITVSSITELALNCESHYYEGPAEGLYFRIDRDGWLLDRAKIVRPDFICGNEHWTRRAPERNKFESL